MMDYRARAVAISKSFEVRNLREAADSFLGGLSRQFDWLIFRLLPFFFILYYMRLREAPSQDNDFESEELKRT